MPLITLPDGSTKQFYMPVSIADVARSIGSSLAQAALAGKLNGQLVDTSHLVEQDAELRIITANDNEGLEILRHSCAHLMAHALQSLFKNAQITIGSVVEDGFYYDFSFERPFMPEDLKIIEVKMQALVAQDLRISRKLVYKGEAIQHFRDKNEKYKVKIIDSIKGELPLSFYEQGSFVDLCHGPHVPSTGKIKAFKLTNVAGVYWRGNPKNEVLQRIYGTAWADNKALRNYSHRLDEAEKRDHRKLAKKYHLFHFQEEAPGMVFWHHKGWIIYNLIEQYIRQKIDKQAYKEVKTPQLVDRSLWERSGHWDKFRESMFTLTSEDYRYAIKPMNCPCHVQIYNYGVKSYRDLPLRLAEFGSCHRYEPSGALHGLMRLRNFVQDDAHIFCTENQIQSEVLKFIILLFEVYADFGFVDIIIRLSTRPDERVGSDEIWDKAEEALELAIKKANLKHDLGVGEGAFYGPKIEFSLRDCIGRVWQCGTIQVDFSMPSRLDAFYVAENGTRKVPLMLHRAILGSIERFIGILIEETSGSFPVWLAPTQAVVLNITDSQIPWAQKVAGILNKKGFRVSEDLRNEKIRYKIRKHTIQRVPYLLVVGAREVEEQMVSVRTREGDDLGIMHIKKFIEKLSLSLIMRGGKSY